MGGIVECSPNDSDIDKWEAVREQLTTFLFVAKVAKAGSENANPGTGNQNRAGNHRGNGPNNHGNNCGGHNNYGHNNVNNNCNNGNATITIMTTMVRTNITGDRLETLVIMITNSVMSVLGGVTSNPIVPVKIQSSKIRI